MANTFTPNVQLAMPAAGDRTWNVPVNGNAQVLDALTPVGALAVVTTEVPSATLNVQVAAGKFIKQDGSVGSYAGTSSQAIAAASTKVLYLDGTAAWALVVAASYPTTPHVPLATVFTGAATVMTIVDGRKCFEVVGSIADGVNWTFGTTTGTQIGTSASQKLGFFGRTPVTQPTVGSAVAGATYTAAEQAILNAVVAAVRSLGLGS
jgi:hypothetical protein